MLGTKILPAAALLLSFCGLLAIVLWLQATSDSAVAAPAVRVVRDGASATTLAPGDVVTLTADLRNEGSLLQDLTVELTVRASDDRVVLRAPRRGVRLGTEQDVTVSWVWRLPKELSSGVYRTEVSVYGPNWSPLYARLEEGTTLTVQARR